MIKQQFNNTSFIFRNILHLAKFRRKTSPPQYPPSKQTLKDIASELSVNIHSTRILQPSNLGCQYRVAVGLETRIEEYSIAHCSSGSSSKVRWLQRWFKWPSQGWVAGCRASDSEGEKKVSPWLFLDSRLDPDRQQQRQKTPALSLQCYAVNGG